MYPPTVYPRVGGGTRAAIGVDIRVKHQGPGGVRARFRQLPEGFGSERLTGALLDRLTHHVHILEMNGESYRLKCSRQSAASQVSDDPVDS